eukprot:SM000385S14619  [mRNA]  locus=s385:504:8518:+ [translate_table: standard]
MFPPCSLCGGGHCPGESSWHQAAAAAAAAVLAAPEAAAEPGAPEGSAPATMAKKGKKEKTAKAQETSAKAPAPIFGRAHQEQPPGNLVVQMRAQGAELLRLAAEVPRKGQSAEAQFLQQAQQSGTLEDKIAALALSLQADPLASYRSLGALVGMMASKGGKRQAAAAMDALRELFVTRQSDHKPCSVILPDRKLRALSQQPLALLPGDEAGQRLLLFWAFEDYLKERYEQFVFAVEAATKDSLPFYKDKALKTVFELLKAKPEQERRLLSALINKLGDPDRKVASKAGYLLGSLLIAHPNMKMVVVQEADLFVFRSHVGLRARYYGAVFLNQIVLSHKGDGPKLAKLLLDIYFALFKAITAGELKERPDAGGGKKAASIKDRKRLSKLKQQQQNPGDGVEADSRLLSALLTGVNRAFPYVATEDVEEVVEEHMPVLFRMVHSGNVNLAVQALTLMHQLMVARAATSDRFFRALYSVLLSPALAKSSKAAMFFSILFKSIKSDLNIKRVAAFTKRLMQVSLHQPASFVCGALMLVSEVLKARPMLWSAVLQPIEQDDELEHFVDLPEEGEAARSESRVRSSAGHEANVSVADEKGDYDAREGMEGDRIDVGDEDNDDESGDALNEAEEDDCDNEDDDNHLPSKQLREPRGENGHVQRTAGIQSEQSESDRQQASSGTEQIGVAGSRWPAKGSYDARARDPCYSGAEKACWWEINGLAAHVHPSVATMARTLLSGANVAYSGDPLRDLALGAFLDRFAEKKPKAQRGQRRGEVDSVTVRGLSLMQPLRKDENQGLWPLSGEEFGQLKEDEVPTEAVFFHNGEEGTLEKSRKLSTSSDSEDDDAEHSDLDSAEIDEWLEGEDGVEDAAQTESGPSYDALNEAWQFADELIGDDAGQATEEEGLTRQARTSTKKRAATAGGARKNGDDESRPDVVEDKESNGGGDAAGDDTDEDIEVGQVPEADVGASVKTRSLDEAEAPRQRLKKKRRKAGESPFAAAEDYVDVVSGSQHEAPAQLSGRAAKRQQVSGRGRRRTL